jgi:hypothetical protein
MTATRERVGELSATLGVLASPSAVAAVALLLLNDHLLKQAWSSPITGKLSDFAGLYFAPWVLIALALAVTAGRVDTRIVAALAYGCIACVFAALKLSPASSEPVLAIARTLGVTLVIVPDPTDLIALPMLPISYAVWARRHRVGASPRWRQVTAFAVSALAVAATSGPPQPSVTDIAASSDSVVVSVEYTSNSDGVYRLEESRWRRIDLKPGALIADPTDPATVYVLRGASWTVTVDRLRAGRTEPVPLPDMGPRPQVFEWRAPMIFAVAPWDARTLFFGHNGTLFVSRDEGIHWTRVQVSGAVQHLALSRDPGVSYAVVAEPGVKLASLQRSADLGATWTFVKRFAAYVPLQAATIAIHPNAPLFLLVGNGKDLQRSTDGGVTFETVYADRGGASIEAARWVIRFDPANVDRVLVVFGSGCCALLESVDRGVTWRALGVTATDVAFESAGNAYAINGARHRVLRLSTGSALVDVTADLPLTERR